MKKEIEESRLKESREQNKNQEKLAAIKLKLDREKMQSAERVAKMKARSSSK
jgi:hypothetical protein